MPLSPLDIESRRFRRELFGYRRSEVESFLQASADALSQAVLDREEISRAAQGARTELEQYRQRERTLIEALSTAEKVTAQQRGQAQQEAQRIIADAQRRSEEMIQRTQAELARVEKQILRLKVERESFESRLNALLDEHRRLLDIRRQELGVAEQIRARSTRPPAALEAGEPDVAARREPGPIGLGADPEPRAPGSPTAPHDHE